MRVLGLSYFRAVTEGLDAQEIQHLQRRYSYVSLYSFKQMDVPRTFALKVQKTPVINLTLDLDEIWSRFRRDTKSGIRKSAELPNLTLEIPSPHVERSYSFYCTVKKQDGALPDIREEFKDCLFFNAYLDGNLILSMSFYDNGTTLRSKHIVSLRKEMGKSSKLAAFATRRVVWEICKYAKPLGYTKIDLGGITLSGPTKGGIAEFKQSFGGEITDMYIYRYETRIFSVVKKILNRFHLNIN